MIFPFISSPSPLPSHSPSLHEDPTSLGRDALPLKLHGEFRLCPSPWLPQQHAIVSSRLSPGPFSTHAPEFVKSFLRGVKKTKQREKQRESFFFPRVFVPFCL